MSDRLVPMRVGDVELLVQTSRGVGTEGTSGLDKMGERVVDGFERAQDAIVEVARTVATTIDRLAGQSRSPDRVEVEFGLKFAAKGTLYVAEASGEATLRVLIAYGGAHTDEPASR